MKTSLTFKYLAAGVLWASLASGSFASILFSTDFDSGYTTGLLSGQSSSSDIGYAAGSSFLVNTPTGSSTQIVDATGVNDLTYSVSGGGTISSGAHSVVFTTTSDISSASNIFSRQLSTNIAKQTIYMRVVVSEYGNVNVSTYYRFSLNGTALTAMGLPAFGLRGGAVGALWDGSTVAAGTVPPLSTPTLLIAAFNWDPSANSGAGGYSSISFWQNPTADSLSTPTATAALTTPAETASATSAFNYINFGVTNFNHGSSLALDSIQYGTTWNDVIASVPEPSTYAMMVGGIGMLLGLNRARKRSK